MPERYVTISLSMTQAKALLAAANLGEADSEVVKSLQQRDYTGPNLRALGGALRILGCTIQNVESR